MVPNDVVPDDMNPDVRPPVPIDPPIRAIAGPATDPATRQPITTARRGMDLFMAKPFRGSPGNAYRFPSDQRAMDRFAELLAADCCRLLVLAEIFGFKEAGGDKPAPANGVRRRRASRVPRPGRVSISLGPGMGFG